MKVLVLGLGSIGLRHLNNLHLLGVEDLSVCRTKDTPPPGKILPPRINVYHDYCKALQAKPDAVIIANPTAFHLESALQALKNGCHVYLEKPISHTDEKIEVFLEEVRLQTATVMVGCQLRFHQNLITIKKWLDSELLGTIYSVIVDMGEYLPDWHPWEDYRKSYAARGDLGGGVILTQIHDLDYVYWLFGPIKEVFAYGGHSTKLDIDVEDNVLISLLAKNNLALQLRMDYWRKPPVRRMHIVAEKGEVTWDYRLGRAEFIQDGIAKDVCQVPSTWDRNDLFLDALKNFLECIRTQNTPLVSAQDGADVLRIALAAKASIGEGGRFVL